MKSDAKAAVLDALGPWSSHPQWRRPQAARLQLIFAIPVFLVVVLLAAIWIIRGPVGGLAFLTSPHFGLMAIGSVAFSAGTLLTLSLCNCMSRILVARKFQGDTGAEQLLERYFLGGGIALLAAALLPVIMLNIPGLPLGLQVVCHFLPALPLLGLIIVMDGLAAVETPRDVPRLVYRRRPLLFLLLMAALALLALTLVHDLAAVGRNSSLRAWCQSVIPWYSRMELMFSGTVTLVPVCILLATLWRVLGKWIPDVAPEEISRGETAPEKPRLSLWGRFLKWWRGLMDSSFGVVKHAEETSEGGKAEPPAWVMELEAWLPSIKGKLEGGARQVTPGEVSPLATEAGAVASSVFFEDKVPTVDQYEAFQRFVEAQNELLAKHGLQVAPGERIPSADMLIEGDVGSGRSSLLRACALYASLVRGQRCLIITPTESTRDCHLQCFREYFNKLEYGAYVVVGELTRENLDAWLESEAPMPQIMVTTLPALEAHVYGTDWATGTRLDKLSRFIRLLEVVLVDDLRDFSDTQAAHLPFVLAKHRLILEPESVPLQLVLNAPMLTPAARDYIGLRFFGYQGFLKDKNVKTLHPREVGPVWRVDISADNAVEAIDQLVVWCMLHDLRTLLYRRGLDEGEKKRQEKHFAAKSGGKGSIRLISCLDDPATVPGEIQAVLYQLAVDRDDCLALQIDFGGGGDTVIVSISQTGDVLAQGVAGVFPVFADRDAAPLLIAHLKNALRFLPDEAPMRDSVWYDFGVEIERLGPVGRYADLKKLIPFEVDNWQDATYHERLGAYVCFSAPAAAFQAVDVFRLPMDSEMLLRYQDQDSSFILCPVKGLPVPPAGHWVNSSGQRLASIDLAYLKEYRTNFNGQEWSVKTISRAKDGCLEFLLNPWTGQGGDPYIPLTDLGWRLGPGQTVEIQGGGCDDGISWFKLKQAVGGIANAVPVDVRITGRFSDYGNLTRQAQVDYQYAAQCSGLILDPFDLDAKELAHAMGDALIGDWSTGKDSVFSPAMTAAVTYALTIHVPRLFFFARPLAFRCQGRSAMVGAMLVWLLEPWGTGNTAIDALGRLLGHPKERKAFFESIHWFLAEGLARKETAQRARFVRRFARCGFEADERISQKEVDEDLQLVRQVLDCADVLLGGQTRKLRVRPQPAVPLPVMPVPPAPVPTPTDWAPDATALTWEECMKLLWGPAANKFPNFDMLQMTGWTHRAWLSITVTSPGRDSQRTLQLQEHGQILDLRSTVKPSGLHFTAAAPMTGAEYRKRLQALLQQLSGLLFSPQRETEAVVCFWLVDAASDYDGRAPQPGDPVTVYLHGRVAENGLIMDAREQPVQLPPQPERFPEETGLPRAGLWDGEPNCRAVPAEAITACSWEPQSLGAAEITSESSQGSLRFQWVFAGKSFDLHWSVNPDQGKGFTGLLATLRARPSTPCLFSYVINDPHWDGIRQLAQKLAGKYEKPLDSEFAKFLLAFVQSFPYMPDPHFALRNSDLPRFPSEFLLNGGGDCEDSSLMLCALLACFGIDHCILLSAKHAAVGIAGPYTGVHYLQEGRKYYYAETATNGQAHPLGVDGELAASAEIIPCFGRPGDRPAPVCVLSALYEGETAEILLYATESLPGPVIVAVFSRPYTSRLPKEISGVVSGSCSLPQTATTPALCKVSIRLTHTGIGSGKYCHDVVVFAGDRVVGRWYCFSMFTVSG